MNPNGSILAPQRLDLKRDRQLEIEWQDGRISIFPIGYLRSMCPCAQCKLVREGETKKKSLLKILPGNYAAPVTVVDAELIGNYALRIDWSDQHGSGIYSFQYLREIDPTAK
jgi:DUF971 family protein